MELSNIEKLLEKYFEGETTLSEEQTLKVYFTREHVAPHLEEYKSMFQYFSVESNQKTTVDFTPIKTQKPSYKWVGIAASIILVIGLFYNMSPSKEANERREAELALKEAKKALNMVSKYMNEGTQDLVYLEEFGNTTKKLLK